MIRLEFSTIKCKKGCQACEAHHLGVRQLASLDRGTYRLSMSEWEHVQETIRAAVKACPVGALNWIDEWREW